VARLDILFTGYVGERTAGTVALLRDGDVTAVVDPGMVPDRSAILDPLAALGVAPGDVTDVIVSHHHPDHTWHVALFPRIRLHDYWATYRGDLWDSRDAEGFTLSESIRLLATPGHTREDVTTLVDTADGVAALTHLWWHSAAATDPLAADPAALAFHRARVVALADLVVPGHGAPFPASEAPG
jgi:glyoxylase-like metal-dependent hydrolase (beta-lactamase superfamily II)